MPQLTLKQKYFILFLKEIFKLSDNIIAEIIGINRKSVRNCMKSYDPQKDIFIRKKGSGRPKKTNDAENNIIVEELKNNKMLTLKNIKSNIEEKNINISTVTISNILKQNGFNYKYPSKKPLLTAKQKEERVIWAQKHLNINEKFIIFSDEVSFYLGSNDYKRWVFLNNDVNNTKKYQIRIQVWGSITSWGSKNIFIIPQNMNASDYIHILEKKILNTITKNKNLIFMDDNDPKHRAKIVTKWKKDNNIEYLDWPVNSPDLNPIENIWGIMKKKLSRIKITSKEELIINIKKIFHHINIKIIKNLYDSFPKRIKKVIEMNGETINY